MAFLAIPGNTQYEYDNAPPDPGVGHPMRALWQKSANGIRTEHGQSNYVRCRRIGSGNVDHGEISKSYWDLRSTVSVYAILTLEPKLVFDFTGNVFKTGGIASTLSNSITHARAGQATMVDSDGLLKWAPHNLFPSSNAFADTSVTLWDNFGTGRGPHEEVVMSNGAIGYRFNVTNDRDFMNKSYPVVAGAEYTFKLWIDEVDYTSGSASLGNVFSTNNHILQSQFTSAGYYSFTYTSSTTGTNSIRVGAGGTSNTTLNFVCGQPHIYRSDLGGMVNNSATGNSYVPTTSSAVYAPRVGHHVYNGSAWVNEGVLHESEPRYNLVTYSNDLTHSSWFSHSTSSFPVTVTPNDSLSPDGTNNASKVTINRNNTSQGAWVNHKVATYAGQYSGSVWLKASDSVDVGKVLDIWGYSSGIIYRTSYTLTDAWVRVNPTGTGGVTYPDNNQSEVMSIGYIDNGSLSPNTGTIDFLIYGYQVEAGSTASSYIPTSGSQVTRAAETLTVPAANLPYSSTNMSIQMDGRMTYADNNSAYSTGHWTAGEVTWYRWTAASTEFLYAGIHTVASRTGQIVLAQRTLATVFSSTTNAFDYFNPDINVPFNIATRHSSTFLNGAEGGTALTAATPTDMPDLSTSDLDLGWEFMGTIAQFRVWDDDLGDTGIVEATLPSTEPSLQLTFDGSSTTSFTVLDWSE